MFCFQCEQAAQGTGCTKMGVCGKNPEVAALQNLIVWGLMGMAFWAHKAREKGAIDRDIDVHMIEGLFTTVTNVDFDPENCAAVAKKTVQMRDKAWALFEKANNGPYTGEVPDAAANWICPANREEMATLGRERGVKSFNSDADINSVQNILLYGCKGMAAYADHAHILGKDDNEIYAFIHKALAAIAESKLGLMDFVTLCMECGQTNIKCMGLLNQAHIENYQAPTPTPVNIGTKAGKAILVSGHDLKMLEELLKQTEGKGINIYTHVEMLPAHGYPGLKKYKHLVGNFGGAWQNQYQEFQNFPGAIIFNTNCIQRPADEYKDRLFTWGRVQWPGVKHVEGWDFSEVIAAAQKAEGFSEKADKDILTGCGHDAVLGLADKVIEAVNSGAIKRFFVIGGCDGAKPGRNYYTKFAEQLPKDTVILTLACGKYRFNKLDLGDIGGIPRLLDVGQCNDAYSAVQIALALAKAFDCEVNDLPLSIILSWYEQKAVVVLLSLLSLGLQNMKLGPSLPAFVTPNVLNFLVENFNIAPIGTVEEDMKQMLG
ncbi:hydroxylamine reductase [Geoalkalibacter ferrihydriticus DSM 17813]|uniref:Hydroxylamine reductase n=2 Tax=Geoalkalibacter ferrihydriticus TaxID=392333 RepID=A0A0C2DXK1_9BACT|nr:hydroxylamine reductase [Geoalkalibacter ferrihydriticus DSM 17813]